MSGDALLSVVVGTRNGAQRLPETLGHLARQKDPGVPWEVLLVDNASTDDTAEVARRCWTHEAAPLHVLFEPRIGVRYARDRAFAVAGDYICIVDDDNWLSDTYLADALTLMVEHPELGVLGGQGRAVTGPGYDFPEWFNRFSPYYAVGPQSPARGRPERGWLYGAGMFLRQRALKELWASGFSLTLPGRAGRSLVSGEDIELCIALTNRGWEILYEPDLVFDHFMPSSRLTWPYFLRLAAGSAATGLRIQELQGVANGPKWRIAGSALKKLTKALIVLRKPPHLAVGDPRVLPVTHSLGQLHSVFL